MWLILWVCLVSLHQASWRQVLTTETSRSDWRRNHTSGRPEWRLLNMKQKRFLAVLHVENKGKANSAASADSLCQWSPGSAAGWVLCAVPQALKDLRSHRSIIHESLKAVKLYTLPPLSKCLFCKTIKLFMKRCDCINKTMLTCNWIVHSRVAFS